MRTKKTGFTLTELIIAVSLIIILSMISVPIYKNYRKSAILAEGYTLLSRIKQAQLAYYDEFGKFLAWKHSSTGNSGGGYTCNEEVLGIDARANRYFTWFNVGGYGSSGFSGYSNPQLKYYFGAFVYMPKELFIASKVHFLALQYNISLGQKIVEAPIDFDFSWC